MKELREVRHPQRVRARTARGSPFARRVRRGLDQARRARRAGHQPIRRQGNGDHPSAGRARPARCPRPGPTGYPRSAGRRSSSTGRSPPIPYTLLRGGHGGFASASRFDEAVDPPVVIDPVVVMTCSLTPPTVGTAARTRPTSPECGSTQPPRSQAQPRLPPDRNRTQTQSASPAGGPGRPRPVEGSIVTPTGSAGGVPPCRPPAPRRLRRGRRTRGSDNGGRYVAAPR